MYKRQALAVPDDLVAAITEALGADQVQSQLPLLDPVWQMPVTWPPVLPDNLGGGDKSQIEDVVKESFFDSQYLATIESEYGRCAVDVLHKAKPVSNVEVMCFASSLPGKTGIYVDEKNQADLDRVR